MSSVIVCQSRIIQGPVPSPRNRRAPFRVGEHVRVVDGPHTGAHGPVDFVDPKGCRALIDFGGGRSGGLTWIAWGNLAAKAAP